MKNKQIKYINYEMNVIELQLLILFQFISNDFIIKIYNKLNYKLYFYHE